MICSHFLSAQITIAEARDAVEGTTVTVKGLVINGDELGDIRYLQDATGSIAAYHSTMLDDVYRGDSILVTGPTYNYNGLLEISSTTSVSVINSGNPLPEPIDITCISGYIEANEGKLLRISNGSFTETGTFSSSGSGTNYDVNDGTATGQIRVVTTTNLDGTAIPEMPVYITGIMSQYAPGGTGGYQLLPRGLTDITTGGTPPVISTTLFQNNITTSSFTVNFTTLLEGNTILYYGTTSALGSEVSNSDLTLSHSLDISGLNAATIYYVKAASVSASNDTSYSSLATMATASNSSGAMHIWFNTPVDNSVSSGTNAIYTPSIDDSIIQFIDAAQLSIDLAIYNMDNLNNIVTALNDAYNRGVVVRVICDAGVNMDAYSTLNIGVGNKKLSPTGTTPDGGFYGIMHNKFLLVDVNSSDANIPWVVGGSANYTDQQLKIDHQNVVAIQDQSLARAYRMEFDEMFSGKFGSEKTNNTPHEFMIGGKRIELYFSPSDDVETRLIEHINAAYHDFYFAIYSYTRYGISYAIEDAVNNGIFAAGIYDETDPTDTTAIAILNDVMGSNFRKHVGSELLHHKYLIVDPNCPQADPLVWTGSHNWTSSANSRNDENTLVIHDSTTANVYYQEFVQRYKDDGGTNFVSEACDLVGIQPEELLSNDIKIYPNPADNFIMIQSETVSGGIIRCIDMRGRIVLEQKLESPIQMLDISRLNSGIYMLSIQDKNVNVSGKVVVE